MEKNRMINVRLTHLLLQKEIRAPSRDFFHSMSVSFDNQLCVEYFPGLRIKRTDLSLLSPALHSLCALRIHDAKVRIANGFNGAPTTEISLRRPLPARY